MPETLCIDFPALFTNHTKSTALAAKMLMDRIGLGLCSRLTITLVNELASLRSLLQGVSLTGAPKNIHAYFT